MEVKGKGHVYNKDLIKVPKFSALKRFSIFFFTSLGLKKETQRDYPVTASVLKEVPSITNDSGGFSSFFFCLRFCLTTLDLCGSVGINRSRCNELSLWISN